MLSIFEAFMEENGNLYHFTVVESSINYLVTHFVRQPSLEEVAAHVHLSPYHFQRIFREWAGISPKKFVQFLSVAHAKEILANKKELTLFDAADSLGLSSTSRLHELFIKLEGMSPASFKRGGKNLLISFQFSESIFGPILIGATDIGICYLTFAENREQALAELAATFPGAEFREQVSPFHQQVNAFFHNDWTNLPALKLHLKGTPFQLKIWELLLKIPMGGLTTYGHLALKAGSPGASRAVGTAVGSNPVSFLVPCHRVIRSSGVIGQYRWGQARKMAMIGWEAAKTARQE